MSILYSFEHARCLNYDNSSRPVAEALNLRKGVNIDINIAHTTIVFITEGRIDLYYEDICGMEMKSGQIMLFPVGIKLRIAPQKDALIFVLRIKNEIQICDKYTLENLFSQTDRDSIKHTPLSINKKIEQYLDHFTGCINDGLRCCRYFDIKIAELFFLLRGYYTKDELAGFFRPLLSADAVFTDFVWRNYRNARNVSELAEMSNYGLSTFKAKFRKIFGVPALQWLNEQKSKNIYHELNCSNKSLKQISSDHHFSSVSHLNTFCKEKLGSTPGKIRRTKVELGDFRPKKITQMTKNTESVGQKCRSEIFG